MNLTWSNLSTFGKRKKFQENSVRYTCRNNRWFFHIQTACFINQATVTLILILIKLVLIKLQLFYSTLLLGVPRLRRQLLFPHPRWFENARRAAPGGFRGSCSLWLPLRTTTCLLGSNPSTLVQKDRPVGSCSGRFCSVHHVLGQALVCLDGAGRQAAWPWWLGAGATGGGCCI